MTTADDRLLACSWETDDLPWVRYRARIDLLGEPEDSLRARVARRALATHPKIQGLVEQLALWPGELLRSHKSAGHTLHKLVFLADIGMRVEDPGMSRVADRIFRRQSPEGPFEILMNVGQSRGGSGEDQWAWMLCDAPLVVYALVKFGLGQDDRVQKAMQSLVDLVRGNGWPCAVAPSLGKFRGPGDRSDPCPYATLLMLKLLGAAYPPQIDEDIEAGMHIGASTLLALWDMRRQRRPFMFGMGEDFAKLKAPLVWYDIMHVTDVLSRFAWARSDPRLQEMAGIVAKKADADGRFTPEAVWSHWREWDFGQKEAPSPWLTLLAHSMLARVESGQEGQEAG